MASTETVSSRFTLASPPEKPDYPPGLSQISGFDLRHFAFTVITAGTADMVRPLLLAALRALDMGVRRQPVVRTAHIPPGR
jgi:hypothetical protein